jgi:hypothetical protein
MGVKAVRGLNGNVYVNVNAGYIGGELLVPRGFSLTSFPAIVSFSHAHPHHCRIARHTNERLHRNPVCQCQRRGGQPGHRASARPRSGCGSGGIFRSFILLSGSANREIGVPGLFLFAGSADHPIGFRYLLPERSRDFINKSRYIPEHAYYNLNFINGLGLHVAVNVYVKVNVNEKQKQS